MKSERIRRRGFHEDEEGSAGSKKDRRKAVRSEGQFFFIRDQNINLYSIQYIYYSIVLFSNSGGKGGARI